MARMSSCTSRILVAVCCCVSLLSLLSVEAPAESPDWVLEAIKDATLDPGELHYFHGVHRDCPVVDSDVERIIGAGIDQKQDHASPSRSFSRALGTPLRRPLGLLCRAGEQLHLRDRRVPGAPLPSRWNAIVHRPALWALRSRRPRFHPAINATLVGRRGERLPRGQPRSVVRPSTAFSPTAATAG